MQNDRIKYLKSGIRTGIPIMLGYLSVGFTLGIAARSCGLNAFQASLASLLLNASAGEFAGFTAIAEKAAYLELAVITLVINARYLLMSCSLSQKLDPKTGFFHRMLIGYDVTDELFGAAISVRGKLSPWYFYGLMLISMPGWALGTCLGVLVGDILPAELSLAFNMGLYGMFIAVVIPPSKRERPLLLFILAVMAVSAAASVCPLTKDLSSGMRIMIITILTSAAAACFTPNKQEAYNGA